MRKSSSARVNVPPPPNSSRATAAEAGHANEIGPERSHTLEPDVMDEEMVPSDLVFVLEHLEFRGSRAVVKLDRGVARFLIDALNSRRHGARTV